MKVTGSQLASTAVQHLQSLPSACQVVSRPLSSALNGLRDTSSDGNVNLISAAVTGLRPSLILPSTTTHPER